MKIIFLHNCVYLHVVKFAAARKSSLFSFWANQKKNIGPPFLIHLEIQRYKCVLNTQFVRKIKTFSNFLSLFIA